MKSKSEKRVAAAERKAAEPVEPEAIRPLRRQLANLIRTGEVIDRPAPVVKELIENSLDAGAREITVEVFGGGLANIEVADDGCRMTRDEAVLSMRIGATSKIRSAADLGAIRTLRFRGQALALIASVSRLQITSRRAVDPEGMEIEVEAGRVHKSRAYEGAPGTRIEVRRLFFNTPTWLKFLKTAATEEGAIVNAFQRIVLANHQAAFTLTADQRKVFELPRASSALEPLRQLFGAKLAESMIAFDSRTSTGRAWGLAATSQEFYATPRMVFTFVNGRAVRDRLLAHATEQAYQTLIPRGRHPAVAMFVELQPKEVDVNLHPMKTEVRFRQAGAVFELVFRAIREQLAELEPPVCSRDPEIAAKAPPCRLLRPHEGSNVVAFPERPRITTANRSGRAEAANPPGTA